MARKEANLLNWNDNNIYVQLKHKWDFNMKINRIALIILLLFVYGCKTINVSLIPTYDTNKKHYTSELNINKLFTDVKISELKLYDISDIINGVKYSYWLLVPSDFENRFYFTNGFPLNKTEVNSIYESLLKFKIAIDEKKGQYKQYKFASNNSDDFIFIEGVIINENFQVKLTFSSLYVEKRELLRISNLENDNGNYIDALSNAFDANSIRPNVIIDDIEELDAFIRLLSNAK